MWKEETERKGGMAAIFTDPKRACSTDYNSTDYSTDDNSPVGFHALFALAMDPVCLFHCSRESVHHGFKFVKNMLLLRNFQQKTQVFTI